MENSGFFAAWGRLVAGRRSRFVTLALWIVLTAVLSIVLPSVTKEENNNAAELPSRAASVVAAQMQKKYFPSNSGTPALIVFYRAGGLQTTDLEKIQRLSGYLHDHPVPEQSSVPDFQHVPLAVVAKLESKDETTLVFPISIDSKAGTATLETDVAAIHKDVEQIFGDDPFQATSDASHGQVLEARITGPVGIATDATSLFKNADITLLAATVSLVLILLILLYRSPLLALVPLISVGFAYGVISPILGGLAKLGWLTVGAQSVSIMTVLLFGAGTDYCLFLVARFREALHNESDPKRAMHQSVGQAGGAIAMSALTVVVSLLTLLFAKYGSDHRFALPFSIAIFMMAIAGLTLVPALLSILGRRAFVPFVPRTPEMEAARTARRRQKRGERAALRYEQKLQKKQARNARSGRMGRLVARRPWTIAGISVVVLLILGSFATQIHYTYNLLDSFPKNMPSRVGFHLIETHYAAGDLAPIEIVTTEGTSTEKVERDLKKLPFVGTVSSATSKVNNTVHQYTVVEKSNPYSNAAMNTLPTLRQAVVDSLRHEGVPDAKASVYISGETATQFDTRYYTTRDTKVVIPIVIAVIALLLLTYLRSIVAMVYLIVTVGLSYLAALGTGWLLLHGVMHATALEGAIPLYAFVFLVALGEDYNIFMISRIWQEARRKPLREAVAIGVNRTGAVITSAGLILAGTFAVLAGLPIQILVQFGLLTALGVLIDTFIVRPFLVPSITAILGRFAFWPSPAPEFASEAKMESETSI
ncbi:MAG: MMPL family transporter [Alicyclobacillaceae bacterium]|nr:MMPL family transporter [Alicyclobacillaceae bacterium]